MALDIAPDSVASWPSSLVVFAANNPKAQEDFAYRAIHLTAVAAKDIIRSFYDAGIAHPYLTGVRAVAARE